MRVDDVAIEARGLTKRYRRQAALEGVDLEIPAGSITALVGPNGAGKSTLLRILAGLSRPTGGIARIAGSEPGSLEAIRRVGYLDQGQPLYLDFRVDDLLRFGRELNPTWEEERARGHLELLGISPRAIVRTLSGGQRAQVAITLCLAKRPRVLLLDEPVAALDPVARDDFMRLLLATVVDDEATVLVSSHAIVELAAVCDHIVILNAGGVVLAGPLEEVLEHHRLLVGTAAEVTTLSDGDVIVSSVATGRQHSLLVRCTEGPPVTGGDVLEPTLEEVVLAYLRTGDTVSPRERLSVRAGR